MKIAAWVIAAAIVFSSASLSAGSEAGKGERLFTGSSTRAPANLRPDDVNPALRFKRNDSGKPSVARRAARLRAAQPVQTGRICIGSGFNRICNGAE